MNIYIAGDSTASIKSIEARPEFGWGEFLHVYLPSNMTIYNHAKNGRSSKSFLVLGHLDIIEKDLKQGDFLIIQFGHNDQKIEDLERYVEPHVEFPNIIKQYVSIARNKGAIPVLLSSITRRNFINEHQMKERTVDVYPEKMIEIAKNLQLDFIDVYQITKDFFESLGDQLSKDYFLHLSENMHPSYSKGIKDDTHLNEKGAMTVASLIAPHLIKILYKG
jgi:lysophospholipase L1-like esterase